MRRDGWLIAAAGLAARVAVALWAWTAIPPTADGTYYHRIAERIAGGHGYTWVWPGGEVTYAAHYPVGYPALLAVPYALFGAMPGLAMLVHALLGALASLAVHRILAPRGRRAAAMGALFVALHPGLVGYTPAIMTEAVTGALWACATWAAAQARRQAKRRWMWCVVSGVVLGAATMMRPQSMLLAPLLGVSIFQGAWRRVVGAALLSAVVLACCLPWTARNCARLDRCALVSVNGGWNLLIGTQPEGNGAWSEIRVPPGCDVVFDEAGKDLCFERAARERILADPEGWLALAPKKLAATFDYCGAAGSYLHAANPQAFPYRAKVVLGWAETIYERLLLVLALCAAWCRTGLRSRGLRLGRAALLGVGLLFAVQEHAAPAYLAVAALCLSRRRVSMLHGAAAFAIVIVAATHVVFFGAGRYQLPLWPLLCGVAALGLQHIIAMRKCLQNHRKHLEL